MKMGSNSLNYGINWSSPMSILFVCVCCHGPNNNEGFTSDQCTHIVNVYGVGRCWLLWGWLVVNVQSNFCMYIYYIAHFYMCMYNYLVQLLFFMYEQCNYVQSKHTKPLAERPIIYGLF